MAFLSAVQTFDEAAVTAVRSFLCSPVLTPVMKVITLSGSAAIAWLVLTAVLMYFPDCRRPALRALAALALAWCINQLLKELFDRPRPFEVIDGLTALVSRPHGSSLPSGHTASSFGYVCALARQKGGKCRLLYLYAGLIAFSRVYVGVHYPTDVLLGAAVGVLGGMAALWLFALWDRHRETKN